MPEGDEELESVRLDRARKRRRRHRILGWAAVAVAVLGLAGWALKPTATDWWIARSACDGALPEGALDALRATTGDKDARLAESESDTLSQLGRYSCEVENEEGERVLGVEAFTRSDDIHARMVYDFQESGERATEALPAGLPGYLTSERFGTVLLRDCPKLGKDAAGRPRQLYVSLLAGRDPRPERRLRAGVAVANKAAEKLGCGGKALPVPPEGTRTASVRPQKAAGTPCAALADGPLRGREWTVDVQVSRSAPVSSCTVRPSGRDDDGGTQRPVLAVTGWYGDWSRRLVRHDTALSRASALRESGVRPWLTGSGGWAMARCGGQAANFTVWVRAEDDTVGDGADKAARAELADVKPAELRSLLAGFAHDQGERRGCEDLRLPEGGAS